MVKVIKKGKDSFEPVTIVLETQEEFDYLKGLTNDNYGIEKQNCVNFNHEIDDELGNKLYQIADN